MRILVTGATGFIGGHAARHFQSAGHEVIAIGRNLAAGLQLQSRGITFRPVDLTDATSLAEVVKDCQAVIHAGALSTMWAAKTALHATNVLGTRHVVEACLQHRVRRLVHISSPSVVSINREQRDLDETTPFPRQFVSPYSETKKLSEDEVQRGLQLGLDAVILRPKAVYGPGDTAIFPRLIAAARAQRLRRVGAGSTLINLSHVLDVVQGIEQAVYTESAKGQTYFLHSGEEISLWTAIDKVLARLEIRLPHKRIATAKAFAIASVLEFGWRLLRLRGEPPLTRYAVGILAHTQTYRIEKAKRELGFAPCHTFEHSIADLVGEPAQASRAVVTAPRAVPKQLASVTAQILNAGTVTAIERTFSPDGGCRRIAVPSLFGVLQHPTHGVILFDTGYADRFHHVMAHFPHALYAKATPLRLAEDQSAVAQLAKMGIQPGDVGHIIISHFDPDHIAGLLDFPTAKYLCSRDAWEFVRGRKGWQAGRARFFPDLLPSNFTARLELLGPHDEDIFSDQSIRLVDLAGHMPGQVGAIIRLETQRLLLVADAVWTRTALTNHRTTVHGLIANDRKKQLESIAQISRMAAEDDLIIVPSHCPQAADELIGKGRW